MKEHEITTIKQAILNEIEGYEFYVMAAEKASGKEVKDTFYRLAEEEKKHVEWLRQLFDQMKEDSGDDFQLMDIENPPTPGIFKWDTLDRKNASIAVSVFGIGMQMEEASVKFYTKAAEQTEFQAAKELYTVLAKWEQVHFEQFAAEYKLLKEEWWNDQSFAPF